MLSFFLAEPGDKLASEVFYIFQMACDLNCTAEGICWDHIIYYQIMRSEMKAYIYKIFILLTLRKSKCSQLHLWQVRFCFVLSSLHLYSINSEHPVLALAKTVAVALSVYQMQKFGLSSASADYQISPLLQKLGKAFMISLIRKKKKLVRELVLVWEKLNEQIHTHSPYSSLKMEMTSLRH